MAVPKRKVSKARRDSRRANWKAAAPTLDAAHTDRCRRVQTVVSCACGGFCEGLLSSVQAFRSPLLRILSVYQILTHLKRGERNLSKQKNEMKNEKQRKTTRKREKTSVRGL